MKIINLFLSALFAVILISGIVQAEESWNGWTVADGLGHDRVLGMTVDNDHNVWCVFESTGGISIWDGTFWDTYTTDDGLPSDYMTYIITNADGKIMVGTYGYGFLIIDNKDSVDSFTSYTTNDGLSGNVVYCIYQARDGSYWFGTHFGGLCHWDGSETWTAYNQDNTPSMPAHEIKSICEGSDGKIWVTTQNQSGGTQEVGCFDPNVISPETTWQWWGVEEGIDENSHTAIAEDGSGNIWITSYGGGAFMYDGETWTHITTSNGLKTDYTNFLATAPDGALWLTGWGGVTRYDGNTYMTWGPQTNDPIDPAAGLMNVWVNRITFDVKTRYISAVMPVAVSHCLLLSSKGRPLLKPMDCQLTLLSTETSQIRSILSRRYVSLFLKCSAYGLPFTTLSARRYGHCFQIRFPPVFTRLAGMAGMIWVSNYLPVFTTLFSLRKIV